MATASSSNEPELRVLTGLQAGARLRLGPGLYRLGGADDCDIVLMGLAPGGHAAELEVDAKGLLLTPLAARCATTPDAEHEGGPLALQLGKAFRLDDIWMSVEDEDMPWPAPDSWLQPEIIDDEPEPADGDMLDEEAPEEAEGTTHSPKSTLIVTACALLLLVGLGMGGFWLARPAPASAAGAVDNTAPQMPQTVTAAVAPASAASDAARKAETLRGMLTGVVSELGYAARLTVQADPDGKPVLVGFLPTASDMERLKTRLAKRRLEPALHVVSDDWLKGRVETYLGERAQPWTVHQVDNGDITLVGPSITTERLAILERDLRRSVGALRSLSGVGRSLADAHSLMRSLFTDIGMGDRVLIEMDSGQIYVTGEADATSLRQVETQLMSFHERFGGVVSFTAKFTSPRDKLPFRVTQAVGGNMPYLVIDDGRRLYPGGTYDGYQLTSMRDRKIVFSGPQRIELDW